MNLDETELGGYVTLDDPIALASAFFESFVISEILKSYYNSGVLCLYDHLVTLRGSDRVIPSAWI
jgi:hypothetical protein